MATREVIARTEAIGVFEGGGIKHCYYYRTLESADKHTRIGSHVADELSRQYTILLGCYLDLSTNGDLLFITVLVIYFSAWFVACGPASVSVLLLSLGDDVEVI